MPRRPAPETRAAATVRRLPEETRPVLVIVMVGLRLAGDDLQEVGLAGRGRPLAVHARPPKEEERVDRPQDAIRPFPFREGTLVGGETPSPGLAGALDVGRPIGRRAAAGHPIPVVGLVFHAAPREDPVRPLTGEVAVPVHRRVGLGVRRPPTRP